MPNKRPLTPPLQSDDVRLLTELGFVAAAAGLQAQSSTMFTALLRLRPERAFPYIGLATGHLNEGQAEQAEAILLRGSQVLGQQGPDPVDAQAVADWLEDRALLAAFQGLALQLSGRSAQARQALQHCLDIQAHGPGARMARVMLGQAAPDTAERPEPTPECFP